MVGGGILGSTTAWELAREGEDVLLLEARRFGEGSTGASAAIVRCHYSNPEVVRMAVRSRDRLRQLPLHLGCDPVYTESGWLFLVDAESALAAAENSIMQDEEGLDSIEVDDLHAYLPGAEGAGIGYALYEPEAGFADPVATTVAYASAARRRGRARARGNAGRGDRDRGRRRSRRACRWRARRVRAPRAGCGRLVGEARARDRTGAAARDHARAGRRPRGRARAGDRVRRVVAGRPDLRPPGARARCRPPSRRPRLPEGVRDGRPGRLRRGGRPGVRGRRARPVSPLACRA